MVRQRRLQRRSFFALVLASVAAIATLCAFAVALHEARPPADPARADVELALSATLGFDALMEEEIAVRRYVEHRRLGSLLRYRAAAAAWSAFLRRTSPAAEADLEVRKLRDAGRELAAVLAREMELARRGDTTRARELVPEQEEALERVRAANGAIDGALRGALRSDRANVGRAILSAKLGSALSILLGLAAAVALWFLLRERRTQAALALSDAITRLPNRRAFEERLGHAVATRRAEERFALLYIDLDRFKPINDRLGHCAGDVVLAACGERIRAALRPEDFVARIGGDEFAAIVQKVANQADAEAVAARVAADVALPLDIAGAIVCVGASVGAALVPEHGDDATALLERADLAMYRVKRARRALSN